MSVNPILKAAFTQGDWHASLCEQLWSIAEQQPSAANLKLALDASHCIRGIEYSDIERAENLTAGRRLTSWQLFFRLCSFDIAAGRNAPLEARLAKHLSNRLGFRQRRALLKFPRVLDYINQHHHSLLDRKLFVAAERARGLLARSISIDDLLKGQLKLNGNTRVALVGNGPSIGGQASGAAIDANDIVVRFNNHGINTDYDPDIGADTHLWVVSPSFNLSTQTAIASRCAVTGADPWTRASGYWERVSLQAVTHIATFDIRRWHALVEQLSAPPSAGLLMIDAIRQAGVGSENLTAYGFTRLENLDDADNHLYDDAERSDRHNWDKEAKLYRDWGLTSNP